MPAAADAGVTPRVPLNRERVLEAAIAFADENGIESLTMRKLGEAVGVEAMSLYNHVANKDDLLDGMVDVVFSEIDLPSGEVDWKIGDAPAGDSARERAGAAPWAIGLMESRTSPGPATLRHHDAVIGCLRGRRLLDRAGRARLLGPGQLHLRVRHAGARPAVRHAGGERRELAQAMLAQFPADAYPHLAELDRRARPAARLRLRRRVRVRPRLDPRGSQQGCRRAGSVGD